MPRKPVLNQYNVDIANLQTGSWIELDSWNDVPSERALLLDVEQSSGLPSNPTYIRVFIQGIAIGAWYMHTTVASKITRVRDSLL